jgi:hypothetical protein
MKSFINLFIFICSVFSLDAIDIKGNLLLTQYNQSTVYSLYDINLSKLYPLNEKLFSNDFRTSDVLKIEKKQKLVYLFEKSYNQATGYFDSVLNIYSLDKKLRIKQIVYEQIQINDYQIINDTIMFTNGKTLILWNFSDNTKKEVYKINDDVLIKSFHYFKDSNIVFIEEMHGLSDYDPDNNYSTISCFNIDNTADKKLIDNGSCVGYSENNQTIIYNGEKEKKIKLYNLGKKQFKVLDIESYPKYGSYAIINDEWVALNILDEKIKKYIWDKDHLDSLKEKSKLVLYNIKTGESKTLLKTIYIYDQRVRLDYIDMDLKGFDLFRP